MAKTPKSWTQRARAIALRGPWTEDEDAELINAVSCGVSLDYVTIGERTLPEILERRLELVEAGRVQHPKPL
jgi:hypothetical protein